MKLHFRSIFMVFRQGGDIVSIIALKDRSRCQRGRFFILR